jgi:hypothetical protein
MRIIVMGLWGLLRGHPLRLFGFAVVATPKNLAGNSLLYVEVSHADINKYLAHAMNFPAMTAIGFITSMILWWSRGTPLQAVKGRFTKIELVMFGSGQLVFAVLCGGFGAPYMMASLFNMVVLGLLHYVLLDKKVFVS